MLFRKFVYLILMGTTACASYGQVLCYGDNGHVKIETAFHDHCDHDHDHGGNHLPDDHHEHITPDKCGPCIDLPFGNEPYDPVKIQKYFGSNTSFTVVALDNSNTTQCIRSNDFHALCDTFFTPLKVIVLLI